MSDKSYWIDSKPSTCLTQKDIETMKRSFKKVEVEIKSKEAAKEYRKKIDFEIKPIEE